MSRKSQAFALQIIASEVAAGTPLSFKLSRMLLALERNLEVQAFVKEELKDQRAVDRAHREIARYGTISSEEVMQSLGIKSSKKKARRLITPRYKK